MPTNITPAPLTRPLHAVAREIRTSNFSRAATYYAAAPYVGAMRQLTTLDDSYGDDDAVGIVIRFLTNANGWQGPVARRVKTELRAALAHHQFERHEPSDMPARARRSAR